VDGAAGREGQRDLVRAGQHAALPVQAEGSLGEAVAVAHRPGLAVDREVAWPLRHQGAAEVAVHPPAAAHLAVLHADAPVPGHPRPERRPAGVATTSWATTCRATRSAAGGSSSWASSCVSASISWRRAASGVAASSQSRSSAAFTLAGPATRGPRPAASAVSPRPFYPLTIEGLLTEGERISGIPEYARTHGAGFGTVRKALAVPSSTGAIRLSPRGPRGTFLFATNPTLLWRSAIFPAIAGMLPLPTTLEHEGLTAALEELGICVTLSHTRAHQRVRALEEGRRDVIALAQTSFAWLRKHVAQVCPQRRGNWPLTSPAGWSPWPHGCAARATRP
jgi:hypothetical protein